MNLTKLFNFSYFLQNVKKSKASIILLILLVPLFTILTLISMGTTVCEFQDLAVINLIGMYIIPLILSIELFSFVHKKNSADFIGSMPISRKSIFCTNTLGGILILILIQILTMMCTLFLSTILSNNIIIFSSMVWDIFIYFTIAYIFVFTVANLAMTFSGNRISQVVSSMLILFLIPFLIGTGKLFYENEIDYTYQETTNLTVDEYFHFTAPNYVIDYIINGKEFAYDSISVNKMIILSIVYIILGVIFFQKKKLEMAGESYETKKVHLGVKLLTLIPFMFFFCGFSKDNSKEIVIFLFAIMAVYYFVFDLITNKKINWKTSIVMFFVSMAVIYSYYMGVASYFDLVNTKLEIQTTEIESILVEGIDTNWRGEKPYSLLIQEEDMIQYLVRKMVNSSSSTRYEYNVPIVPDTEASTIEPVLLNIDGQNVSLKIRLRNGKEYPFETYWNADIWNQILERYGVQKFEKNLSNMRIKISGLELNPKVETEILEILNRQIIQMSYQEIWKAYQGEESTRGTTQYLLLYDYAEHTLKSYRIPYFFSKELLQKMIQIHNQEAIKKIDKVRTIFPSNDGILYDYIVNYCEKNQIQLPYAQSGMRIPDIEDFYYKGEYNYGFSLMEETTEELREWMRLDVQKEFRVDEEYLVLESHYPNAMEYYTNDIDGICKIYVEKFQEVCARIEE